MPNTIPDYMKPYAEAVNRVHSLLQDPHPGMMGWLAMFAQASEDLQKAMEDAGLHNIPIETLNEQLMQRAGTLIIQYVSAAGEDPYYEAFFRNSGTGVRESSLGLALKALAEKV